MLSHHNHFPKHNNLKTDFPVETKITRDTDIKDKCIYSLPTKRSLHGNKKVQINAADEGKVAAVKLLVLFSFDSQ